MSSKGLLRPGFIQIVATIIGASLPLLPARGQVTYAQNILGYVDANFPAGSNLVANPLFASDNTISNLFRSVPSETYFLPWDGATFGPTNQFTLANGWAAPGATFLAPNGGFLWLPSATKITFIGQPWATIPGPICLTYPQGVSVSSWLPANICGICENPNGCPPYSDGTMISRWNRQTQSYDDYVYFGEPFGWMPSTPSLDATESARFVTQQSFNARGPFAGMLGGGSVPQGLPWVSLRNPQRNGANLTFHWPSTSNINYAVFCSTNLNTVFWQLAQQGTATSSGGMATITVAGTNSRAFCRVLPDFGASTVLLGGHRGTATFGFQFYAPAGTNYTVERVITLGSFPWELVTTVTAGPSNIVSVVDTTATAASGYYRIRY